MRWRLSVDEAIAAGATRVDFSQALPVYVDNFLDFPVGGIVPTGWYDREKAAWIPSDNGRIVKVLGKDGDGLALLDVNGSGNAASTAQLAELRIDDSERAQLASLYPAGKSLWRVPTKHFTPWDYNWPYGPAKDSTPPPPDKPKDPPPEKDSDECGGCSINPQARTVGEALPFTASPYALHYQSRRAKGYKPGTLIDIPLAGASVPGSLKGIELTVAVAGRTFTQAFPAAPNQSYRFAWDGLDAYGRPVAGSAQATVTVGYRYNVVYYAARSDFTQSFAQASREAGTAVMGQAGASTIALTRTWQKTLFGHRPAAKALGGWSLSPHHSYDAVHRILELGTGERREAHDVGAITTVAGTGQYPYGYGGDGGPATQAKLYLPWDVALGPDGSRYIADKDNHRIRRVGTDGVITTVAGTGQAGYGGDGGPATQAKLSYPEGIAVGSDGGLYIADRNNQRIRHVGTDGVITTVAGTGQHGYGGDGGPATQAKLLLPVGIAVGPDGGLYIADPSNHRIRQVGTDGVITTVVGTGQYGYGGDGGPATQAKLSYPEGIAVGPDGGLYIADTDNQRIRRVGADGVITTVAGTGQHGYGGDGGPATQAKLYYPRGIAVGPDGGLYIADTYNHRIRRVGAALPGFSLGDALIPSPAGLDLYHFDPQGKHLRTLSALTGAELYRFAYDATGRLREITDGDGNTTRIERDSEGSPTGILSPDGQRTALSLDPNGYLASVTNLAGETHAMTYTAEGLLAAFTDPKGQVNTFAYDELGRLTQDTNAGGGGWTVLTTERESGYSTAMTTTEGRTTSFSVDYLSTGDRRQVNTYPDGTTDQAFQDQR